MNLIYISKDTLNYRRNTFVWLVGLSYEAAKLIILLVCMMVGFPNFSRKTATYVAVYTFGYSA